MKWIAVAMFLFWLGIFVFVVGSITVAAVIGGGLLYGASVLLLLLLNSYVWSGGSIPPAQGAIQVGVEVEELHLADYRNEQLPPPWPEHLTGAVIEIDGESWTVNEAGELVEYHAGDGLAELEMEMAELDSGV